MTKNVKDETRKVLQEAGLGVEEGWGWPGSDFSFLIQYPGPPHAAPVVLEHWSGNGKPYFAIRARALAELPSGKIADSEMLGLLSNRIKKVAAVGAGPFPSDRVAFEVRSTFSDSDFNGNRLLAEVRNLVEGQGEGIAALAQTYGAGCRPF